MPTNDDLARDLAADLALCEAAAAGEWSYRPRQAGRTVLLKRPHWEIGVNHGDGIALVFGSDDSNAAMIAAARSGWPAAICRAQAAELALEQVIAALHGLEPSDARVPDVESAGKALSESRDLYAESARLRRLLADTEAPLAELGRLRAILDAPGETLFADGRQPTENERHLLSWRRREAVEARTEAERLRRLLETADELVQLHQAEVVRLRGIVEGLTARVAAQADCLARSAERKEPRP